VALSLSTIHETTSALGGVVRDPSYVKKFSLSSGRRSSSATPSSPRDTTSPSTSLTACVFLIMGSSFSLSSLEISKRTLITARPFLSSPRTASETLLYLSCSGQGAFPADTSCCQLCVQTQDQNVFPNENVTVRCNIDLVAWLLIFLGGDD